MLGKHNPFLQTKSIYGDVVTEKTTGTFDLQMANFMYTLQWRHNGHDGVSNHQPHDCLLNRLFRRRSKKTSKLRVTNFVRGINRWPVNSTHKWPVTQKMFPFDDVIMEVLFTKSSSTAYPWYVIGWQLCCPPLESNAVKLLQAKVILTKNRVNKAHLNSTIASISRCHTHNA